MSVISLAWAKLQKRMRQKMNAGATNIPAGHFPATKPAPDQRYDRELFERGASTAPRALHIGLDPTTQFATSEPTPRTQRKK